MDAARYARCLAADYLCFERARAEADEVMQAKSNMAKVELIKRKLLGIGYKHRTKRLNAFLETELRDLPSSEISMDEKKAYRSLVTAFFKMQQKQTVVWFECARL